MRYAKDQHDTTHRRITGQAASMLRERGIAQTGIAGLMAASGLTNGAFYAHFASKEALVAETLRDLADHPGRFVAALESGAPPEQWLRLYLSTEHRDHPQAGCAAAALAAEIARHPADTRRAFGSMTGRALEAMARQMPGDDDDARLSRARAVYALLIGTLQFARAAADASESDAILDSGVAAGLALCGVQRSVSA